MERLDKYLSDQGAGTRSQVRLILKAGRVCVDGRRVTDGSVKISPETQDITLDGVSLRPVGTVVLMMNKPAGYVTAHHDPVDKTVMDLLPPEYRHLGLDPVGRLDKMTEGLLLLTNDGELLHRLISPRREISKVYYARHEGTAGEGHVLSFAAGLTLGDGTHCKSAVLEPIGAGESLITVTEGKYHQVRRMMAALEMPVLYLERRKEGFLELNDLPRGAVRPLSDTEIKALREEVGLK